MKRIFRILTLASLVMVFACNEARREQDQDTNEVAEEANDEKFNDSDVEKDADFVADAVASDLAEIQLAQLASQKATSPEVKEIAKMLETEHSKSLAELQTIAQAKAITIPSEPKQEAKNDMEKLRNETAADFDKKWLEKMEDEHEKCIDKFEKRAEKGEDADVKAFASKTLPHLKMHLEKVKSTQEKMKANS